ncbi:UvrD-helicase domain-containing protein [Dactylosporangium sp. CA-139114]|uniref:UvrD-helicase domain-containing protein n=1 Tax=Dactylosporangium sp. CA-139114 TaxID=3239931 RepID=UPI003D98BBEE
MTARLSLYRKAEQELYKLDRAVKAQFYDFSHLFRNNPDQPGLDLKKLKGDSRIYRAKINQSYRALLTPLGVDPDETQHWLVIAVRHRKDVYEELQVAVNRVTGEIEFVDLAVVGSSALRRAGITLTPAEPDSAVPAPQPDPATPTAEPILSGYTAEQLRALGVAEQLIDLALAVTSDAELDELLDGAPLLSKDVLYGLASGMDIDEVRTEITAPVQLDEQPDLGDFVAAATRTKITAVDLEVQAKIDEGDFRTWKVYLHPTQERIAYNHYKGPVRVSGGPGTGKTIVALHRVRHLAKQLPPGDDKPILLTTFTMNLATDLRLRLASLIDDPTQLARVDVTHIDQLAARVLGENATQRQRRQRIADQVALTELRQLLAELDERRWDADFLLEEWDQVILGQSVTSRSDYFQVRRAGRGKALTRPERNQVWKLIEQLTARLDKLGVETWGQAAERAARHEIERAVMIESRRAGVMDGGSSSSGPLTYRYRHIVVDEAQDLRAAHWKMLRAMADPTLPDDMFIAGDTHQRIYDHQVALGALGINIRGRRSMRLTLSYRTTREILARALLVADDKNITYDDLDDGTDNLAGYRSVLHGPVPTLTGYATWEEELAALAATVSAWRAELSVGDDGTPRDPAGTIAVCVADREHVDQAITYLTAKAGISCAELTKDGPSNVGDVHVGTMHRFKGLEYQKLAIIGASHSVLPRPAVERYRRDDPARYERELRKARALLFVAATRARDTLAITWHGQPSPLLAAARQGGDSHGL